MTGFLKKPRIGSVLFMALTIMAMAALALLYVAPVVSAFWFSTSDVMNWGRSNAVGPTSPAEWFGDGDFLNALLRTLLWGACATVLKVVLGLIIAAIFFIAPPGIETARLLLIPAWLTPTAIGGVAWGWIFNGQFGLLSDMLNRIGLVNGTFELLSTPLGAFVGTIVIDVWIWLPLTALAFFAALRAAPREYEDIARIEGVPPVMHLLRVLAPHIFPTILGVTMFTAALSLCAFDGIWSLTQGGPVDSTTTLAVLNYKMAFGEYQFGRAAASALMSAGALLVLLGLCLLGGLKVQKLMGASSDA